MVAKINFLISNNIIHHRKLSFTTICSTGCYDQLHSIKLTELTHQDNIFIDLCFIFIYSFKDRLMSILWRHKISKSIAIIKITILIKQGRKVVGWLHKYN